MSDPTTSPPPSPDSRALSAISSNLDALGEFAVSGDAKLQALTEAGEQDAQTLGRIERKLDAILDFIRDQHYQLGILQSWRGEHEREHARAAAE